MIWVEVLGTMGRDGVVAEGRDHAAGQVVAVSPVTARRLLASGRVRVVEPPAASVTPAPAVAEMRRRTR